MNFGRRRFDGYEAWQLERTLVQALEDAFTCQGYAVEQEPRITGRLQGQIVRPDFVISKQGRASVVELKVAPNARLSFDSVAYVKMAAESYGAGTYPVIAGTFSTPLDLEAAQASGVSVLVLDWRREEPFDRNIRRMVNDIVSHVAGKLTPAGH